MNYTTARCGHPVIAVGATGSMQRRACESRTCGTARCRSDLPKNFSEDECDAWCWLTDCGINFWSVNLLTRRVTEYQDGVEFPSLVHFAASLGRR